MAKIYDEDNIFRKILDGVIPAPRLAENDHAIAINDISPVAPIHILIIPKGNYRSIQDFSLNASKDEMSSVFKLIAEIAETNNLAENGYRLISNCEEHGGQEVFHLHFHILAGEKIGKLRA